MREDESWYILREHAAASIVLYTSGEGYVEALAVPVIAHDAIAGSVTMVRVMTVHDELWRIGRSRHEILHTMHCYPQ